MAVSCTKVFNMQSRRMCQNIAILTMAQDKCITSWLKSVFSLGGPISYLASHEIDADRRRFFFFFLLFFVFLKGVSEGLMILQVVVMVMIQTWMTRWVWPGHPPATPYRIQGWISKPPRQG